MTALLTAALLLAIAVILAVKVALGMLDTWEEE